MEDTGWVWIFEAHFTECSLRVQPPMLRHQPMNFTGPKILALAIPFAPVNSVFLEATMLALCALTVREFFLMKLLGSILEVAPPREFCSNTELAPELAGLSLLGGLITPCLVQSSLLLELNWMHGKLRFSRSKSNWD